MNSFKGLSVFLISLFFIASTFAASKITDKDMAAVKNTVQEFSSNLDKGNANGVMKTISDKSTFVQVIGVSNKISEYSYNEFLSAIKNRQVGGWERQLEILNVDAEGNIATAKIQAKDARFTTTGYITLLKENDSWKIISCTYYMALNQN